MSSPAVLRLFVAIDSNDAIRSVSRAVKIALSDSLTSARWVSPKNTHLTLRFLGNVRSERVEEISLALRDVLEGLRCFTADTSSFGAFPNTKKARVIWFGLRDSWQIANLYEQTNSALLKAGIPASDRKFRPHFTIARLKKPGPVQLDEIAPLANPPRPLAIKYVTLYSSALDARGSVYERLAKIALLPEQGT